MGFFSSLFSKEERKKKALQRNLKKAIHKNIQTEDRYAAMQALLDDGSDEAIYGLLKRFTIKADSKGGLVVDEEEKAWVYKAILSFGSRAIPLVKRFIQAKEGPAVNPVHSISTALDLYLDLTDHNKDAVYELFQELIAQNPPGYERDPIRKEELINFLHKWDDDRMAALIAPYVEDMNETIRFLTVEALLNYGIEEIARERLLPLFDPEINDSLRIHNRLLAGFADKGWSIKGARSFIDPLIKNTEYVVQRGDTLVKKKGK